MDQPHPLILLALVACAEPVSGPAGRPLADLVVDAPGHTGEGLRDAARVVNGVRGGGRWQGGTDVFSLGLDPGEDTVVLGFSGGAAVDVEGPDLAVFENPFEVRGGGWFVDPVVVEVSADCEAFVAFPHHREGDPAAWDPDPATWPGFAGLGPVLLHEEEHPVDPLSPEAGGDRFDLADLDPADPAAAAVRAEGAACVRLTSAAARVDPETGLLFPKDPISDGADLDGVYAAEVE